MTGDSSRGIGFPTLWLFVESLHGDHEDLGFAVALFSAGRIVSSPVLGHLSDVWGYRLVLTVAMCVMATGCLFYMSAGSLSALYVAQFSIGMGAGVLGVTRAYVFCSIVLPFFSCLYVSVSLLTIYYCLPAFSDIT
jgi:MFS family permease